MRLFLFGFYIEIYFYRLTYFLKGNDDKFQSPDDGLVIDAA